MMNEAELLLLIGRGESDRVDFKRDLDLASSQAKAEFIKDVIAIANSSSQSGFLIIGVDDNENIVGVNDLEEERLQQIAQSYINPPVILKCENIPVASSGFNKVGVTEIRATSRPHKVSRAISFLSQNDVFIRHGTITAKASPEEIIRMHREDNEQDRDAKQYVKSAETHLKLENYESAISALSKAIDIVPSGELFFRRANARRLYCQKEKLSWHGSPAQLQFTKDLTDAITLIDSTQLEKEARLLRYQEGGGKHYFATLYEDDYEWLKMSYQGIERANFIFEELTKGDFVFLQPKEALPRLQEVLDLCLEDARVYFEICEAHFCMANYGLALEAIEKALELQDESDTYTLKNFFSRKGCILARIGRYTEAKKSYSDARSLQIHNDTPVTENFYSPYPRSSAILLSYSVAHEFGESIDGAENLMLRALI